MAPRRKPAPVPRKRPVQERSAVTVDAILQAVEQVLDRHGLAGFTTNRVAEVAGVSVGTLYQYYPNKEALIRAVQERYLSQTLGAVRAVLAAAAGVPIADVVDGVERVLVATAELQRPIHRSLIELRTAAEYQEPYRVAHDRMVDELTAFFEARHDVCFADPRSAAFAVWHAVEGIVEAYITRSATVDLAAIAAEAAAMMRAYVAANPRRPG